MQILGNVPSSDVLLTVFRGKKDKDQNPVSCTNKIAYFWLPQGMIIFPGGERLKWNFRRGEGSILGADFGKTRKGRGLRENPFRGGYGCFLEPHIRGNRDIRDTRGY